MRAGDLRHRITIQAQNSTTANPFCSSDGNGNWTTVAKMWAQISPITGKEVYQVGSQNMKVSHKITIRYPGQKVTISAGYRVLYKSHVYQLQTGLINPDERNIELQLFAYELNPFEGGPKTVSQTPNQ